MFEIDLASFRNRRAAAEAEAIKAITSGSYTLAMLKLVDAISFSAAEDELQFQREVLDDDRHDER